MATPVSHARHGPEPTKATIDDPIERIARIDFYRIRFSDDDAERAVASARFRQLDEPVSATAVLEHLEFGEPGCVVRGPEPSPYPAGSIEDFAGEDVSAGEVLTLLDSGNSLGELRMVAGDYVTEGRYVLLSEPDAPVAVQVPGDTFPALGRVESAALAALRGAPRSPNGSTLTAGLFLPRPLPTDLPFHWRRGEQPRSMVLVGFSSGESDERSASCLVLLC